MRIRLSLILVSVAFFVTTLMVCVSEAELKHLKGGWYYWDPYQYPLTDEKDVERLVGLDIAFEKAIAQIAGYKIDFDEVGWKKHIEDIRDGNRDLAAGATKTPQREEFGTFSIPYRTEENSLFIKSGSNIPNKFESPQAFLDHVKNTKMRLGVTSGFIYADPIINEFIANSENSELIFPYPDDAENIKHLNAGDIDGFLADRISATTAMWRLEARSIQEVRLNIATPIHLIFSKKRVSPQVVEEFNAAITKFKASKKYGSIISEQLFSVLLLQTISQTWFLVIDIIGTVAFAVSGLVVAYRERSTLFGAIIMASLPSVGGGVVRDILVNRPRLGVFLTPTYIYVILLTTMIGFIWLRLYKIFFKSKKEAKPQDEEGLSPRLKLIVQVFDAMGLAAYTITGVMIAVISRLDPLWIWGPVLAVLTGAGGGILRDMLRSDHYISALKDELYAEVALVWGFIYCIFLDSQEDGMSEFFFNSIVIVMMGVFVTRMIAVYFNIRSVSFVLRTSTTNSAKA